MNLQVFAPHQECVYNCPFCVARGHKHKYQFKDIYKDGLNQDYFNALKRTIKTCNIDTVIITGECDPTQNMRRARKVAVVICDDEGNLHDDDYLFNPYSGVGYKLRHTHELNPECPIAEYEEDEGTVGVYIYDTAEDAIEAWNRRVDNG